MSFGQKEAVWKEESALHQSWRCQYWLAGHSDKAWFQKGYSWRQRLFARKKNRGVYQAKGITRYHTWRVFRAPGCCMRWAGGSPWAPAWCIAGCCAKLLVGGEWATAGPPDMPGATGGAAAAACAACCMHHSYLAAIVYALGDCGFCMTARMCRICTMRRSRLCFHISLTEQRCRE